MHHERLLRMALRGCLGPDGIVPIGSTELADFDRLGKSSRRTCRATSASIRRASSALRRASASAFRLHQIKSM